MKKIDIVNIKMEDIVLDCISNYRDIDLKQRFTESISDFIEKTELLDIKAIKNELHCVTKGITLNDKISKKEMVKLYDKKFVASNGRKYYDRILNSTKHGTCPYCKVRPVSQLDHFMAKSEYPAFAISPNNLVPSCKECNESKSNKIFKDYETTHFHPYYEDLSNYLWLDIELKTVIDKQDRYYEIKYLIKKDDSINSETMSRLKYTFNIFKLENVYEFRAIDELENQRYLFSEIIKESGSKGLKDYIQGAYDSFEVIDKNSWRSVLYLKLLSICSELVDFYTDNRVYK